MDDALILGVLVGIASCAACALAWELLQRAARDYFKH